MQNDLIFVQWDSYFGGLERITQLYEETFSNYKPLVVVLRQTKPGISYKNILVFQEKNKLAFIYSYFLFVKRRRHCIFHIQYTNSLILLITFLAGARKILYHFHGTKFTHQFIDRTIWKSMENRTIVIANSVHTQRVMREKLKLKTRITIIPNLIKIRDLEFIERNYKDGENFIITYAGRFDEGKNINLILETAKLFLNNNNRIQFILVGDGPEKESIQNKINESNLKLIVKLIPYTNKILEIYYTSNLFIFTSLHESFGNVIAEAILTGLPVLSNKLPALTEFVKDDIFFFDKQEPELIAAKIRDIKNNYPSINQRLKKVNEHIRDYLNNEKIISSINSLYENLNKPK